MASPPLRLWLYVAALAISVFAALTWYRVQALREAGEVAATYAQRYLAAPHPEDRVRVLGLGSSLLWAATPPSDNTGLQGVEWLRITKSNAGIGYLRAVLDVVDHAPPDVLVIETSLLQPPPPDLMMQELRYFFSQAGERVVHPLLDRIGIPHLPAPRLLSDQDTPLHCQPLSPVTVQKQTSTLIIEQKQTLATAEVEPDLRDLLLQLSQRGVHVVLLDLRRSAHVEQQTAELHRRWLQRWRTTLPPGPYISYLTPPGFREPDLYCDGRHMNQAGARRFARWWAAQLQQMTPER